MKDNLNLGEVTRPELNTTKSEQSNNNIENLSHDSRNVSCQDEDSAFQLKIEDECLEVILVHGFKIEDIGCFTQLKSLEILNQKNILNLTALCRMSYLTTLRIIDCGVMEINTLASLKMLKFAYLMKNQISEIPDLRLHSNLVVLDLSFNAINDLFQLLSALPESLEHLNLAGNQISSSKKFDSVVSHDFFELPKLISLNLAGNRLAMVEDISILSRLCKCQEIKFLDENYGYNTICYLNSYEVLILQNFESINSFDRLEISPAHKRLLENDFDKASIKHIIKKKSIEKECYDAVKNIELFLRNVTRDISHINTGYIKSVPLKFTQQAIREMIQLMKKLHCECKDFYKYLCRTNALFSTIIKLDILSGGNIRYFKGAQCFSWYRACQTLIRERSVGGILIYHRIFRVYNKSGRLLFKQNLHDFLKNSLSVPNYAFLANLSQSEALQYCQDVLYKKTNLHTIPQEHLDTHRILPNTFIVVLRWFLTSTGIKIFFPEYLVEIDKNRRYPNSSKNWILSEKRRVKIHIHILFLQWRRNLPTHEGTPIHEVRIYLMQRVDPAKLIELDLSATKLTKFDIQSLSKYKSLRILNISRNNIRQLKSFSLFVKLNQLHTFDASLNDIGISYWKQLLEKHRLPPKLQVLRCYSYLDILQNYSRYHSFTLLDVFIRVKYPHIQTQINIHEVLEKNELCKVQKILLYPNVTVREHFERSNMLTELDLSKCCIDCSHMPYSLTNIGTLKKLLLNNNNLNSLAFLRNWNTTFIKYLDVQDNQIESTTGIEDIKNLTVLDISRNKIASFSEIQRLTDLFCLLLFYAAENPISENTNFRHFTVFCLKNLKALDNISIVPSETNAALRKYAGVLTDAYIQVKVPKLSSISKLNMSNCNLKEIEPNCINQKALPQLSILDLSDNQLQSIVGIGELKKLTVLNLSGNLLSNQSFHSKLHRLYHCVELSELNMGYNQISKLGTIYWNKFPKLSKLDLMHNNIGQVDFRHLRFLQRLKHLIFDSNKIKNIVALEKEVVLTSLKHLSLQSNELNDVNTLSTIRAPKLKILNLSYNKISSIDVLSKFSCLEDLRLDGNPAGHARLLYPTVSDMFPKIKLLNRKKIESNPKQVIPFGLKLKASKKICFNSKQVPIIVPSRISHQKLKKDPPESCPFITTKNNFNNKECPINAFIFYRDSFKFKQSDIKKDVPKQKKAKKHPNNIVIRNKENIVKEKKSRLEIKGKQNKLYY